MKKVLALMVVVVIGCSISVRVMASDTPADPKFNAVEWYKCEIGRVKYKQGLAEKESKLQCVTTEKVGAGSNELKVASKESSRAPGFPAYVYYAVMKKDAAQYLRDKDFKFQCDKDTTVSNGGFFKTYMLSKPEESQYDGENSVSSEFGKKGLVINDYNSVNSLDPKCMFAGATCQFYSTQTNTRFGLFKQDCN